MAVKSTKKVILSEIRLSSESKKRRIFAYQNRNDMKQIVLTLFSLLTMSTISAQNKTLVAYFSATGTTKNVATELAAVANADLHEIKPAQAYTSADLDWHNKQSRSSVEMANKSSRPAITDKLANMSDYQTVYVGFPIWWDTAPTIVNTFFESYDFKGKTVYLFATSGGSSINKAVSDLKATYPEINIKSGRLLNVADKKVLQEFVGKQ